MLIVVVICDYNNYSINKSRTEPKPSIDLIDRHTDKILESQVLNVRARKRNLFRTEIRRIGFLSHAEQVIFC